MRSYVTLADPIVPAHHPRVLAETAVAQGADRAELLMGTGLTPDMLEVPESRISYGAYGLLVDNALRLTGNPALGLDAGKRLYLTHMGMMGLAAMSSATLGDALQVAQNNYALLVPAFTLELQVREGMATLSLLPTLSIGFESFAYAMMLAGFDTQARFLYGGPLPVRHVRLACPRPAYADRLPAEFYDVPYVYDAEHTEVAFDAWVLGHPISFADPSTARMSERVLSEQSARLGGRSAGLEHRVRAVLHSAESHDWSLEDVASRLKTSSRTLRRELAEMGTSFRTLRDETRLQQSQTWLRGTDMTFDEIAGRLGFSDARAFRRAYKRWTGMLPSEERHRGRRASATK